MSSNKTILLVSMLIIGFILINDYSKHKADFSNDFKVERSSQQKVDSKTKNAEEQEILFDIESLNDSNEVEARIEVIDAQLKAKNLIAKLNDKKANSSEQEIASELIKERSLLVKRKVELSLEKLEKEYL